MSRPGITKKRLQILETQLQKENPVLVSTLQSLRTLDRVGHRTGLLPKDDSYAGRHSWWPMIAVLGTYSAGKSSFINWYLDGSIQRTGNQAVDDKFTVISYAPGEGVHTLPGVALDTDTRFPFFQISREIDRVAPGEGVRIDAYLQLKTCNSSKLKGKILIDSPGFDADSQRTSTLRITNQIMDISDLVLIFFDARHPEPGAMRDTLDLLVANTVARPDSNKFLYILNQMDMTAREDNPEEVVAAWQRALSEKGLTSGRFFSVYNPDVAVPIEDEALRQRFESRRESETKEILERMRTVSTSRSYRVVNGLEATARKLQDDADGVTDAVRRWRRRVLWTEGITLGAAVLGFFALSIEKGWWNGLAFSPPWWDDFASKPVYGIIAAALLIPLGIITHVFVRRFCAASVSDRLEEPVKTALRQNTRVARSVFIGGAAGWGKRNRAAVTAVIEDATGYIESLNNRYAGGQTDAVE